MEYYCTLRSIDLRFQKDLLGTFFFFFFFFFCQLFVNQHKVIKHSSISFLDVHATITYDLYESQVTVIYRK